MRHRRKRFGCCTVSLWFGLLAGSSLHSQNLTPTVIPELNFAAIPRTEGVVSIIGLVNKEGEVTETRVASGRPAAIQDILRSVLRWKFAPLTDLAVGPSYPATVIFCLPGKPLIRTLERKPMAPIGIYLPPLPSVTIGVEGKTAGVDFVVLLSSVNAEGIVTQSRIIKYGKTNQGLEAAVLEATQKWRFEPAQQGGQPIASTVFICFLSQ
jgi:TonB family protein